MSEKQLQRVKEFLLRTDTAPGEVRFAGSLESACERYGQLTPRQWSSFQTMEANYSPEVLAQRQAWYDNWDELHASRLAIAADYYLANPPYYEKLARKIKEQPKFIPSKKEYGRLVENNKYVQKVLTTLNTPPIFPVGVLVQVRKTAKRELWSIRERIAVVVTNSGHPVTSATKGARVYTILPFGEPSPVEIQERYLKKKRG